jgi:tetratricopeptide (TPR) repeat protein
MRITRSVVFLMLPLIFAACSTAPKNSGEVYQIRAQAENQLDMGNKTADRGDYETALVLLNEARRLAIITDDPGLLIRTALSRGNVLFSLGRAEEASASWEAALAEAEKRGTPELAAVSRVHIARGRLLSPGGASSDLLRKSEAASVLEQVNREMNSIKSDKLYTAFAWIVYGLAERDLGRHAEAEASVKRSLAIHEKERYFEQAAYDWFLIASIRSLSGSTAGAAQALESAIGFDRRVENSWGLAADWRALGDVYQKAGKAAEAREAYSRAAAIFRALGEDGAAAEAENRIP